ncbi:MAG: NUDIX domain-containing protein [Campylobacterales bacterium]
MQDRFRVELLGKEELVEPKYVKPFKVNYLENGIKKDWEVVEVHDSVSILLYDESKEKLLLVKQVRPAIFLKDGVGITYELCAGILDKNKSSLEIASEEIEEETGYRVKPSEIERITKFYTSVGFAGSGQELFFAKIDDSKKLHKGGGVEDENIELFYLDVDDIDDFIFDETKIKTPGLLFALTYFKLIK